MCIFVFIFFLLVVSNYIYIKLLRAYIQGMSQTRCSIIESNNQEIPRNTRIKKMKLTVPTAVYLFFIIFFMQ